MRRQTAEKVVDLLGLVEEQLRGGRPRKWPGRPRAEAEDFYGQQGKLAKMRFWNVEKVSLPTAFRWATTEQEYSEHVRREAEWYFRMTYGQLSSKSPMYWATVSEIDANELDTRELIRAARAARRYVEKHYLG